MADATDAARKLAEDHGIDLDTVAGTGKDGQIIQPDILKIVQADEEFNIPADRAIPEEYEDHPPAWKRAYAFAANYSKHNGVKACIVFAETQMHDAEFQEPKSAT